MHSLKWINQETISERIRQTIAGTKGQEYESQVCLNQFQKRDLSFYKAELIYQLKKFFLTRHPSFGKLLLWPYRLLLLPKRLHDSIKITLSIFHRMDEIHHLLSKIDFYSKQIPESKLMIERNFEKMDNLILSVSMASQSNTPENLLSKNKIVLNSKTKIIIFGGHGQAKVVIDLILKMDLFEIAGLVTKEFSEIPDLPQFSEDNLQRIFDSGITHALIAIGDNKIRKSMAEKAKEIGFTFINAFCPTAIIAKDVVLGKGVTIMPGSIVNTGTRIGDHAIINTGATIDHDCLIEDYTHVAPGSHIAGNVHLGTGSFLGIGTKVIPNIKIGAWAKIGAGAVVIHNIQDYETAVGVPAIAKSSAISSAAISSTNEDAFA